jgi:hypothetical protein
MKPKRRRIINNINNLIVQYWPPPMTMNAILATIVCCRRASTFIRTRGVDRSKLITAVIYYLTFVYYFVWDLAQYHGQVAHTLDRVNPLNPHR